MTALTLAQFRTRIATRLVDASNAVYSTSTIDEALLAALHDYSAATPLTADTVLTLPGASREIALASLTGLMGVLSVEWPYSTLTENWPPNVVQGFRLMWDDAQPLLVLPTKAGAQPQLGDSMRIWYTKPHTISSLDSASVTTIPAPHESGLVTGAAGYTLLSQRINAQGNVRLDPSEDSSLNTAAGAMLKTFWAWLDTIKASIAPTGDAWGPGWSVDKWDSARS